MYLYTHISHMPTRMLKAGALPIAVLPVPDISRKSVNVLLGKCWPKIGDAVVRNVLGVFWGLVGLGGH